MRGIPGGFYMQLIAENVACVRGGREVFADVSFALGAGEALLVTGRNGAGKSSLLRLIAGLIRRAGGTLTLAGADAELTIGEQAHYLGHQDAIKAALTVAENLRFWCGYLGGAPKAALEPVGLADLAQLPAGYLSAGQKRRLSLSRLVAIERPLWLLDEPTSVLDETSRGRLADLMRAHLAGGGMIIAASHGPIGLERARELRMDSA